MKPTITHAETQIRKVLFGGLGVESIRECAPMERQEPDIRGEVIYDALDYSEEDAFVDPRSVEAAVYSADVTKQDYWQDIIRDMTVIARRFVAVVVSRRNFAYVAEYVRHLKNVRKATDILVDGVAVLILYLKETN